MKTSLSIPQFLSWVPDARVQEKLDRTCFAQFQNMAEFKCNNKFVKVIMSHLEKDDKFTFGDHRLYLGLEDIFYISGLPVDGDPIVSTKIDNYSAFNKLFGV
ncbi:hypothetical protein M5689_012921 [Euphorbia peplus]|nr:hypothetical protein M5689_012921 [Euphorbia peplus]